MNRRASMMQARQNEKKKVRGWLGLALMHTLMIAFGAMLLVFGSARSAHALDCAHGYSSNNYNTDIIANTANLTCAPGTVNGDTGLRVKVIPTQTWGGGSTTYYSDVQIELYSGGVRVRGVTPTCAATGAADCRSSGGLPIRCTKYRTSASSDNDYCTFSATYDSTPGVTETVTVRVGTMTESLSNLNNVPVAVSISGGRFAPPNPKVTGITSSVDPLVNLSPVNATVTFDKPVTTPQANGFTAGNATIGTITPQDPNNNLNTVFTVQLTPTTAGTPVTLQVKANAVQDGGGNNNDQSALTTWNWETNQPSVDSMTDTNTLLEDTSSFVATLTFSEPITGLTDGDFTLANATIESIVPFNGANGYASRYLVTLKPQAAGTPVQVQLKANTVSDIAGNNQNTVSSNYIWRFETTKPSIQSFSNTGTRLASADAFNTTLTFSEAVSGLSKDDFRVSNGAVESVTAQNEVDGFATSYVLSIKPQATNAPIILQLVDGSVTDEAANQNDYSASYDWQFETTKPEVQTLDTSAKLENTAPFEATIIFTEPVTGLTKDDFPMSVNVTVQSVTAQNPVNDYTTTYKLSLKPTTAGNDVSLTLTDAAVTDRVGNTNNPPASNFVWQFETTKPTVTGLTTTPNPVDKRNGVDLTLTFSEPITTPQTARIIATNASVVSITPADANATHNDTFTVRVNVNPTSSGFIMLVRNDAGTDAAGNGNTASGMFTFQMESTKPSVTGATGTTQKLVNTDAFTTELTFSEPVTGLTKDDVTVTDGVVQSVTPKNPVDGFASTYTLSITPGTPGRSVTVRLNENLVADRVGNQNTQSSLYTWDFETIKPTIKTLTDTNALLVNGDAFNATIVFSELVTSVRPVSFKVTNGTIKDIVPQAPLDDQGHATTYVLSIEPKTVGSDVTVQLQANSVFDRATNGNDASGDYTWRFESTKPHVANFDIGTDLLASLDPFDATLTFSEPVKIADLDASDFGTTNVTVGTITPVTPSNGYATAFTVQLTPVATTENVSINLQANKVSDQANNPNLGSGTVSRSFEKVRPGIRTIDPTNWIASYELNITFTEPVTGLATGDFVLDNGTLTTITKIGTDGNPTTDTYASVYRLKVAPTVNEGTVTFSLNADAVQDQAGNRSAANVNFASYQVDTLAPVPTITAPAVWRAATAPFTVTIAFSEPVIGFSRNALQLSANAEVTSFTPAATLREYTFEVRLKAGADASQLQKIMVQVPAGVARDGYSNANTAADVEIIFNPTAPLPNIYSTPAKVNNTNEIKVPINFQVPVSGFEAGDVELTNATFVRLINFHNDTIYHYVIKPTGTGDIRMQVKANSVSPANLKSNIALINYNASAPTVTIDAPQSVSRAEFSVLINFSEDVQSFSKNHFFVTNGEVTKFEKVTGRQYRATIRAKGTGNIYYAIPADVARDGQNNGNVQLGFSYSALDVTPPTVQFNNVPASHGSTSAFTISVQFNEAIVDFGTNSLTLEHASVQSVTPKAGGTVFDVVIKPADAANVIGIELEADKVHDAAGNAAPAIAKVTVLRDTTAPTASFGKIPTLLGTLDAIDIIVQFDEAVSGLQANALAVTGATVQAVTNGTVANSFRVTLKPTGGQNITVQVKANQVQDIAGNRNSASGVITIGVDTTAPSVAMTGAPVSFTSLEPFVITATFSEDVIGFTRADFVLTNATASNFVSVNARVYRMTVTPAGTGDITIDIPAAAAADAAGNSSTAAPQVIVKNNIVALTQKSIANFMTARSQHILANQPDILSVVNGSGLSQGGPLGYLGLNATKGKMDMQFSTSLSRLRAERAKQDAALLGRVRSAFAKVDKGAASPASKALKEGRAADAPQGTPAVDDERFDIWLKVGGAYANSASRRSNFWAGYLGAHYKIMPDIVLGGLLQVDWAEETNRTANTIADGYGWMFGPYLAGRIPGTELMFETRAAWGQSYNTMTLTGVSNGKFDTTRFLVSGKLKGQFVYEQVKISPAVSVTYFNETQKAYRDSLGNAIPGQTIALGELRFGPTFSYDLMLENGWLLTPSVGVEGVWNFAVEEGAQANTTNTGTEQLRARINAGLAAKFGKGVTLNANGYVDGIGAKNYKAYGGNVKLGIRF